MIIVERNHLLTKTQAISTIDNFLNELMKQSFPGSVKINEPKKSWNGDSLKFSFKIRKGFFSSTIEGVINVNDTQVVLISELPGIVKTLVKEDKIKEIINEQLDKLF